MRRNTARFILSAASAADFPRTGFAEIALVGRSNVGKSSLINALVGTTLARTSAAPGKTRLANFYLIESPIPNPQSRRPFYFVDLPGYGYARGGEEAAKEFELLAGEYFDVRGDSHRQIAGIFHLIDARHPDLPQDLAAHRWIAKTGVPIAVIASKIDKLNRAERANSLRVLEANYDAALLPESAPKHEGFDEIWKTIHAWLRSSASGDVRL